jgi:hypothetical protein
MKDPFEVLRMKERDTLKVKQEIEALRITAELLGENLLPPATGQLSCERSSACPSPGPVLGNDR